MWKASEVLLAVVSRVTVSIVFSKSFMAEAETDSGCSVPRFPNL